MGFSEVYKDLKEFVTGTIQSIAKSRSKFLVSKETNIRRSARRSLVAFPMITSDGVSPEMAMTVNKATEREYAAYVRMALHMEEVIDLKAGETKEDLLERLGIVTAANRMDVRASTPALDESASAVYRELTSEDGVRRALSWASRDSDKEFSENPLSESVLTEKTQAIDDDYMNRVGLYLDRVNGVQELARKNNGTPISFSQVVRYADKVKLLDIKDTASVDTFFKAVASSAKLSGRMSSIADSFDKADQKSAETAMRVSTMSARGERDAERTQLEKERALEDKKRYIDELERIQNDFKLKKDHAKMEQLQYLLKQAELEMTGTKSTFKENDYKKVSDAAPTMLDIQLLYRIEGAMHGTQFVLGVKVFPHIVKSEEIVENVVAAVKGSNFMFSLLRVFSGEKAFWKDLVGRVEESKKDIEKMRNSSVPGLWFSLKTLRDRSRISRLVGRSPVLPTSTLLMTEDEARLIKEKHGIDVSSPRYASKLTDAMNLLGLIIVNEGTETVYVWDDEESRFMTHTASFLQEENKRHGNDIKSVIDYMNRRT